MHPRPEAGKPIWRHPNHDTERHLNDRAWAILHRMALERRGWRGFFRRWFYADEPLRNDAANLLRERATEFMMPLDGRYVGDMDR